MTFNPKESEFIAAACITAEGPNYIELLMSILCAGAHGHCLFTQRAVVSGFLVRARVTVNCTIIGRCPTQGSFPYIWKPHC